MISSIVSRCSAVFLGACGLALLFAPTEVLGAVAPGVPAQAHWLLQLLAGAWLGVASMNWNQRAQLIGGIYGRPMVYTNFVLYFVSAMSLVRVVLGGSVHWGIWLLTVPMCVLAATYAALMFRGPFDPLTAVN